MLLVVGFRDKEVLKLSVKRQRLIALIYAVQTF